MRVFFRSSYGSEQFLGEEQFSFKWISTYVKSHNKLISNHVVDSWWIIYKHLYQYSLSINFFFFFKESIDIISCMMDFIQLV